MLPGMTAATDLINPEPDSRRLILDVPLEELPDDGRSFRRAQLADWIYRQGARDFESMTNLPRDWRSELAEVLGSVGVLALPAMVDFPARLGRQATPPNPAAPALSLSGMPVLALPLPSGGLMPASIQLVAPDHHEPRLLATGARIEAAVS